MRLDEVTHAAEVPSLERGAKIVDRGEREENVLRTFLAMSQLAGRDNCTSYSLRSQQRS